MQTKPEAEVASLNGARQVPLLRREQIVAGMIFCGIASDHVHEVMSVMGDTMSIQRLPREAVAPGHVHAFTQFGETTCACGLSNRPIAPFLPEDGTTPRAHVLEVEWRAPVTVLVPYSIYMAEKPDGTLMTFSTQGDASSQELPVITRAVRIWGLPDAAIQLIKDAPAIDVRISE